MLSFFNPKLTDILFIFIPSLFLFNKHFYMNNYLLPYAAAAAAAAKSLHLCPTLSDPVDCSLPGSSVHGIFQARVREWVAIAFSVLPSTRVEMAFI